MLGLLLASGFLALLLFSIDELWDVLLARHRRSGAWNPWLIAVLAFQAVIAGVLLWGIGLNMLRRLRCRPGR